MNAAFASFHDFLAMGGYAFYVWLAVGFTLVPLLLLIAHTRWQRRALLNEVRRQQDRDRRVKASQSGTMQGEVK